MKIKVFILILCLLLLVLSCDESLPPRIAPENTLQIVDIWASQMADAAGIFVKFLIIGENLYEETFDADVNVNGELYIKWKRKPEKIATIHLNNTLFAEPTRIEGRTLTLDPGEQFYISVSWYLNTDDGENIIDLLDFSDNNIQGNIATAKPEVFEYETKVIVFDQIGLLISDGYEFTLEGWKMVDPDKP